MIGDCFFVASVSSMALDSNLTTSLFLDANLTNSYKFKMFVHGKSYDVIVDDTVPVFKPVFD